LSWACREFLGDSHAHDKLGHGTQGSQILFVEPLGALVIFSSSRDGSRKREKGMTPVELEV
jgi:hypothetical protein